MKPKRILIGGLPFFGRMLADVLEADGWETQYLESPGSRPSDWVHTATTIARADLIYLVGGQIQRNSRPDWLSRFGHRPIVMHWVGSDVTFARGVKVKGLESKRLEANVQHWVEVPWTGSELAEIGIQAEIVPLTSARLPSAVPPFPSKFTVLAYLPPARPAFYGSDGVLRLAAQLPEARFLIAGATELSGVIPSNVEFLGWRDDMSAVYAESTVLLRQPEHDGLSFMVLESLAAGRYAIWNHPFEGALAAETSEQALVHLTNLLERHTERRLPPNDAGRAAVAGSYSVQRIRSEILGRFASLL